MVSSYLMKTTLRTDRQIVYLAGLIKQNKSSLVPIILFDLYIIISIVDIIQQKHTSIYLYSVVMITFLVMTNLGNVTKITNYLWELSINLVN